MRVFRMGTRFDPRYRFSTWVFTIAKNLSSNELRDYRSVVVELLVNLETLSAGAELVHGSAA